MSCRLRSARRHVVKARLVERDGARCFFCAVPFAEGLADATIDHLIPYRRFPRNLQVNMVLACQPCNFSKGNQSPERFLRLDVEELAARCGCPVAEVREVLRAPADAATKTRNRVLAAMRSMAALPPANPVRPPGHNPHPIGELSDVTQVVADHPEGLAGHLPGHLADQRPGVRRGDGPQGHSHGAARRAPGPDVPVEAVRLACS